MPFHSTATEEEAERLVILYSRLGWDRVFLITADWPEQDILAAMESARKQFHLEE